MLLLLPWVLFFLLLVACQDEDGQETPTPAVTETVDVSATPRASRTPEPTATATATPEPPEPEVTAVEQAVGDDGEVIISSVVALDDGWLVLYTDEEGEVGEPLGHVAVEEGENSDLRFTVDPYLVTDRLHAVLHSDQGELGTFEFPGVDTPLEVDGDEVAATFEVDLQVTMPQITVSDQGVGTGQVTLESVTANGPGWVAIHTDDEGEPGSILGQTPVSQGTNNDVAVTFNWRNATRQLHAVLYHDAGEPGRFEPSGEDEPVVINEEPIRSTFTVALPPDVMVIDQPIVTNELVIERATINEPGWVSVHTNFEGFIDRLLGYAPLEPGVNRNVVVPIDPQFSTSSLHVMLHTDTGVQGEFEYPAEDPALRDEDGRSMLFTFQTDAGNYIVTRDQPLGEDDTVTIPLVVTDLETWVTVWTNAEGAPGELLGQTLVERGVHRNLELSIDADAATDVLHVVLIQDAGVAGELEYPDGPDIVLQREGSSIQAPFGLLSSE
jgi:hypothetical protein